MKGETLEKLSNLKASLIELKKKVVALNSKTIARKKIRDSADSIATFWVEELRSPLEYKFKIQKEVIIETSALMKRLHILSRPNNLKSSYISTIKAILKKFDDRFILPIKQKSFKEEVLELEKIIPNLTNLAESNYLEEAINCANANFLRASIVLGWCCAIDRIQKKIIDIGFEKFNNTSKHLKNQTRGKFKRWNKEFSISTISELQEIFDCDLIIILEGMGLIDGNQAQRLNTCFQYRNQCAHPGAAPIEPAHLVVFFTDINNIILQNSNFII